WTSRFARRPSRAAGAFCSSTSSCRSCSSSGPSRGVARAPPSPLRPMVFWPASFPARQPTVFRRPVPRRKTRRGASFGPAYGNASGFTSWLMGYGFGKAQSDGACNRTSALPRRLLPAFGHQDDLAERARLHHLFVGARRLGERKLLAHDW